jgi:DNA-directed RNA polymerase specialized sigma24 family protein
VSPFRCFRIGKGFLCFIANGKHKSVDTPNPLNFDFQQNNSKTKFQNSRRLKMSWNNGYERKKFEARQKKQAEEYKAQGMTEEQIKAMYEFDLEQYKSDRRYHLHTQPFSSSDFDDGEDDDSESTLLNKFFDELTVTIGSCGEKSRYWWIEEINNPKLAEAIKALSPEQFELLTLVVIDGYTQAEAAKKMGIPYRTFKFKLRNIKNFLRKF